MGTDPDLLFYHTNVLCQLLALLVRRILGLFKEESFQLLLLFSGVSGTPSPLPDTSLVGNV